MGAPSILDLLAPQTRTITVQGVAVEVRPLTTRELAFLMARHPSLAAMAEGTASPLAVMAKDPDALAGLIATAMGLPPEEAGRVLDLPPAVLGEIVAGAMGSEEEPAPRLGERATASPNGSGRSSTRATGKSRSGSRRRQRTDPPDGSGDDSPS